MTKQTQAQETITLQAFSELLITQVVTLRSLKIKDEMIVSALLEAFEEQGEHFNEEDLKTLSKDLLDKTSLVIDFAATKVKETAEETVSDIKASIDENDSINFRLAMVGGSLIGSSLAMLHTGVSASTLIGTGVGVGVSYLSSSKENEAKVREQFEGSEKVLLASSALVGAAIGAGGVYVGKGVSSIASKMLTKEPAPVEVTYDEANIASLM